MGLRWNSQLETNLNSSGSFFFLFFFFSFRTTRRVVAPQSLRLSEKGEEKNLYLARTESRTIFPVQSTGLFCRDVNSRVTSRDTTVPRSHGVRLDGADNRGEKGEWERQKEREREKKKYARNGSQGRRISATRIKRGRKPPDGFYARENAISWSSEESRASQRIRRRGNKYLSVRRFPLRHPLDDRTGEWKWPSCVVQTKFPSSWICFAIQSSRDFPFFSSAEQSDLQESETRSYFLKLAENDKNVSQKRKYNMHYESIIYRHREQWVNRCARILKSKAKNKIEVFGSRSDPKTHIRTYDGMH